MFFKNSLQTIFCIKIYFFCWICFQKYESLEFFAENSLDLLEKWRSCGASESVSHSFSRWIQNKGEFTQSRDVLYARNTSEQSPREAIAHRTVIHGSVTRVDVRACPKFSGSFRDTAYRSVIFFVNWKIGLRKWNIFLW